MKQARVLQSYFDENPAINRKVFGDDCIVDIVQEYTWYGTDFVEFRTPRDGNNGYWLAVIEKRHLDFTNITAEADKP